MHLENMKQRYLLLDTFMLDHLGMELMVVPLLILFLCLSIGTVRNVTFAGHRFAGHRHDSRLR